MKAVLIVSSIRLVIFGLAFACAAHGTPSPEKEATPAKAPAPLFEAFQLSAYLKEQTIETITDAIQVAWRMEPARSETSIRLKFHPETQQLFVSDSKEAIEIVRRVVSQLRPIPFHSTLSVIPNPTPADEQRRLEAVADEVRKRRILRENASIAAAKAIKPFSADVPLSKPAPIPTVDAITPAPPPVAIDSALSDEVKRRRDTRATSETKGPAPIAPEKK